jgi:hypothetical protein
MCGDAMRMEQYIVTAEELTFKLLQGALDKAMATRLLFSTFSSLTQRLKHALRRVEADAGAEAKHYDLPFISFFL